MPPIVIRFNHAQITDSRSGYIMDLGVIEEEDDEVEQEPVVTHILPRRELTSTSTMIRMLIAREQLESSYERMRPSSTAAVMPTISEDLEEMEKTSPIPSRTGFSRESIEEEARRLSLTAIHSAFSAAVSVSEGGCRARFKPKRNILRGLVSCLRSCFSCMC
ncbi:uncharacterized protein LOC134273979 [Saccostrea cucullata]|uniref:uncharacterized protein LOC134273979 n=1 Tax=Saccostrea cuccullata TaxID=36930 RepID=UPI002ED1B78F